MKKIYIGKQKIFDKDLNVHGYELLFRKGPVKKSNIEKHENKMATENVIYNTLVGFGRENIVSNKISYINFPEELLNKEHFPDISPANIGVEILETVTPNKENVDFIQFLKEKGFTISLDDFVFHNKKQERLIQLADLVKIDIENRSWEEIEEQILKIKKINPSVKLLSERIETKEDLNQSFDFGFDYFQGFYMDKPETLTGIDISDYSLIELFNINEIPPSEIKKFFNKDPNFFDSLLKIEKEHKLIPSKSIDDMIDRHGLFVFQKWIRIVMMGKSNI